jgi:hypothetical protein
MVIIKRIGVLIAALAVLSITSCQEPFDFTKVLDGEEGKSLSIDPSSAVLTVNKTITLAAVGGIPPYTFSIKKGKGTIDLDTGVYTAPSQPGTDIVEVVDDYENSSKAKITIKRTVQDGEDNTSTPSGSIDYFVTNVTSNKLTVYRNGPVTEQFTIKNKGTNAGTTAVQWKAYISTDAVYSSGDILIASGTIAALESGQSKTGISIGGTWPYTGSFYLIVRTRAADETKSGWDYTYSGAFSVNNTPDYSITSVNLPIIEYGGNPGENINSASGGASQDFVIHNDANGGNGNDPINWAAYLSADTTIDGGDTMLGSGIIAGGLPSGGDSAAQSFGGDDNLPANPGVYYILITISADDDYNTGNDRYTSVQVLIWDTTNSETDTTQDDTMATAEDYHVILNPDDILTINGTLDANEPSSDFFIIRTGPGTTELDIRATWTSLPVLDLLDMYLYNSSGDLVDPEGSSTELTKGAEPEEEGDWTPGVSANSLYYLEVRIDKAAGGGDPYILTITTAEDD